MGCEADPDDLIAPFRQSAFSHPIYATIEDTDLEPGMTVFCLPNNDPVPDAAVHYRRPGGDEDVVVRTDANGWAALPAEFVGTPALDLHVVHPDYELASWLGISNGRLDVAIRRRAPGKEQQQQPEVRNLVRVTVPNPPDEAYAITLRDARSNLSDVHEMAAGATVLETYERVPLLTPTVFVAHAGPMTAAGRFEVEPGWTNVFSWGAVTVVAAADDEEVALNMASVESDKITLELPPGTTDGSEDWEWNAAVVVQIDGFVLAGPRALLSGAEERLVLPWISDSEETPIDVVVTGFTDDGSRSAVAELIHTGSFRARPLLRRRQLFDSTSQLLRISERDAAANLTTVAVSYGEVNWYAVVFDAREDFGYPPKPPYLISDQFGANKVGSFRDRLYFGAGDFSSWPVFGATSVAATNVRFGF